MSGVLPGAPGVPHDTARRAEPGVGDAGPAVSTRPAFDLAGPLPSGTTVLEASAGTGKTYTVSGLAARFLAEGVTTVDRLLVVTFGVLATAEVRERTRRRLAGVVDDVVDSCVDRGVDSGVDSGVDGYADGGVDGGVDRDVDGGGRGWHGDPADPVARAVASGDPADVARRLDRLRRALAGFDAATVDTTHGFCNRMLTGLGLAADVEPDPQLVTSSDDVVRDVVTDLYLRRYSREDPTGLGPPLTLADAMRVAGDAVAWGDARLLPEPGADDPSDHPAVHRHELARAVRDEVARRKRARRLRDYADMLTGLRDALRHPVTGPVARQRMRSSYDVVLVDEFQDTDPVQWEVLREAFHGHATLVLVGDPKQSIYRFRGADVATYLDATASAGASSTLATNYRSDAPLLRALDHLLGGAALGDPLITVRPVAAHHAEARLVRDPPVPPLRLRVVSRGPAGRDLTAARARDAVTADVARDAVALLGSGAALAGRPLRPADVAVLVRTNAQARAVHDALAAAGVPVTLSGADSVFAGPTATQWRRFLHALEQPHRSGIVRAAALTCFVGWTAERLHAAGPHELDALSEQVRGWAGIVATRGVAALVESVTTGTGLPERLLAAPGGERVLTDLRHIGQLLHDAEVRDRLGLTALAGWLRRRIDEAGRDQDDERSVRLDSDAAAVQVLTVHRSKGLEWPVVYAPFLWDRWVPDAPDPLRLHDADGRRALDVGGQGTPGWVARLGAHQAEEAGEDLRLLYVALTRAAAHVVTWWVPATTTKASPLHRVLFGRERGGAGGWHPPTAVAVPGTDARAREVLDRLAAGSAGTIAVEDAGSGPVPALAVAREPVRPAPARRLTRPVDTTWSRLSYSRLAAAAHDGPEPSGLAADGTGGAGEGVAGPGAGGAGVGGQSTGVGSEPETPLREDEPGQARSADADAPGAAGDLFEEWLRSVPSPMSDLPSGAQLGSYVHAVLDGLDTAAADLPGELRRRAREAAPGLLTEPSPDAVAEALLPSLRTPLGPTAGDRALADVPPADRLDEMAFELPLAGWDAGRPRGRPGAAPTLRDVAAVLRRHLTTGDPLVRYPRALEALARASDGPARSLRGYLTGSIDALLRLRGRDGAPDRYVVVDYKTNRLAPAGEPLTAWHYRPESLVAEMVSSHYPLQALLYAVAAHRFLRGRVPDYDPEAHLGGALYLFLRGMSGPDTPVVGGDPAGVFAWHPPAALVVELSALLDGGST